jgi:hypothetical protein
MKNRGKPNLSIPDTVRYLTDNRIRGVRADREADSGGSSMPEKFSVKGAVCRRVAGRAQCRVFFHFLGFLLLLALCGIVAANPPASVQLSYNLSDDTMQVTILHLVQDPSTHYVRTVEIRKNGQLILTKNYSSQPSASSPFTYTYPVSASPGDTLEATAVCNIQGSTTGSLIVPGAVSSASASPSPSVTSGISSTTNAGLSLIIPFAALAGAGMALLAKKD